MSLKQGLLTFWLCRWNGGCCLRLRNKGAVCWKIAETWLTETWLKCPSGYRYVVWWKTWKSLVVFLISSFFFCVAFCKLRFDVSPVHCGSPVWWSLTCSTLANWLFSPFGTPALIIQNIRGDDGLQVHVLWINDTVVAVKLCLDGRFYSCYWSFNDTVGDLRHDESHCV